MRYAVKLPGVFTIFILFLNVSQAQFKPRTTPDHDVTNGIERVIEDFPNQFKNIIGEPIIQNPQSTDYHCNIAINDAEESLITKYTSSDKNIYSWQAVMLTTEDFEAAKRKFHSLYSVLNNHPVNGSLLKGDYEAPAEDKTFTSVLFSLSSNDEATKRIKVELVMESQMMDWKIKVLVYDREREDNEKGSHE